MRREITTNKSLNESNEELSANSAVKPDADSSSLVERLIERNLIPDWLIRSAIRRLCAVRLREQEAGGIEQQAARRQRFIADLKQSPVAIHTGDANAQHYEAPTEFFQLVLGKHLKYSCSYWQDHTATLDEAEEAMLALYVERARLADGQAILELGCGWGSLALYLANLFPHSRIVGVSNSRTQKEFIQAKAINAGLHNLEIITADMNAFAAPWQFDRIVSIEMFEHMRNYEKLLARVAAWLQTDGLLFVHIFAHQRFAYPYEVRGATDWMAKHFFTGGIMPSDDLLFGFQKDLRIIDHWQLEGTHYRKTCEAWLQRMDAHREQILKLFGDAYGEENRLRWFVRWRLFFMACATMFAYSGGSEWGISHYLFKKHE